MNQNVKKIIIAVIILILLLAIIWIVYEQFKLETAESGNTNILPNENTGIDNVTNEFTEDANLINEINSEDGNIIANEVTNEEKNSNEDKNEQSKNENSGSNNGKDSEKVYGTVEERQERAVELAKEFYEEKYGNSDELNFDYEALNGDGRYIVRAGTPGFGVNKFFFVNLETEIVEEM